MTKVSITPITTTPITGTTITSSVFNHVGTNVRINPQLIDDKFAKMDAMLEFVERFVQEDERAKAIWIAIKAKKRILT